FSSKRNVQIDICIVSFKTFSCSCAFFLFLFLSVKQAKQKAFPFTNVYDAFASFHFPFGWLCS
ncbi:hypothetical protein NE673_30710, partial [Blautia producta]|nr:hypothetical protein [Blautia producta]